MSPSVYIIRRVTRSRGVRYQVRYRLGGRESPPRSAGTFGTLTEAKARARWVSGELAAMRVPDLRALEPVERRTLTEWADRFVQSRIDVSASRRGDYMKAIRRLGPLGAMDPADIRPADVAAWVAALAGEGLRRATLRHYLSVLQLVLDHAGAHPNPARDQAVRLPAGERREIDPPTLSEIAAVISAVPERFRLPLRVLRDTGCRVGELRAMTWGDLDVPRRRWRIARSATKTDAGRRWVPLNEDLLDDILATRPDDADPGALVFGPVRGLKEAMGRACQALGIRHMHPHSLRHAFASRLIAQGVPVTQVSQLLGHAKRSLTLDTYAHVVLREEDPE